MILFSPISIKRRKRKRKRKINKKKTKIEIIKFPPLLTHTAAPILTDDFSSAFSLPPVPPPSPSLRVSNSNWVSVFVFFFPFRLIKFPYSGYFLLSFHSRSAFLGIFYFIGNRVYCSSRFRAWIYLFFVFVLFDLLPGYFIWVWSLCGLEFRLSFLLVGGCFLQFLV